MKSDLAASSDFSKEVVIEGWDIAKYIEPDSKPATF